MSSFQNYDIVLNIIVEAPLTLYFLYNWYINIRKAEWYWILMRSGLYALLGKEWGSFICILQSAGKSTRISVASARGADHLFLFGGGGGGGGFIALNNVWAGENS